MLQFLLFFSRKFTQKQLLFSKRIAICSVLLFSQLLVFPQNTEIDLYKTFTGRYNYTMIGNSFNSIENSYGYWYGCYGKTNTSDSLILQTNDKIVAAYLYWSTFTYWEVTANIDREVELNGTSFKADTVYTNNHRKVYSCRADITDFIKQNRNKTYTMRGGSFRDVLRGYCLFQKYRGWAVVVVYENKDLPFSSIYMSEGLESVHYGSIDIEVRDVNVTAVENSHLSFLAWEGDAHLEEDEIIYFDTSFPPKKIFKERTFNNTHTFHNPPTTIYNMDLDDFDLSKNLEIGLNQDFYIRLQTGNDLVHVNTVIFSVNNVKPNPSAKVDTILIGCKNGDRNIAMQFDVVNTKSSMALPPGVEINVWADSIGKSLLFDTATTEEIPIDSSQNFSFSFNSPINPAEFSKVILTVNLDNQGKVIIPELDTTDNVYTKTLEPTVKIRATASDTDICIGERVTLNAIGKGDVIEWKNGVKNNVAFTPETTATYVVTARDTTLECEATDSITITVSPLPKLSLTVAMNDTTICLDDSVLVSASGADSISWNYDVENGEYFTPSEAGNFNLVAKGFNRSLICKSDTLWDTVVVRVAFPPKPTLTISSPSKDNAICLGDSVQVSASGSDTIYWNYGLENEEYFIPSEAGSFKLVATGINFSKVCGNDTVRDTVIVKAATRSKATMAISSPSKDKAICLGDSVQVSASGSDTIFWNHGLENGKYFIPSEVGIFELIATGINFSKVCGNDTVRNTVILNVTSPPKPTLTISSPSKDNAICLGDSVQVSASGSDTIYWNYGLENEEYFIPSEAGSFKLVATGINFSKVCGNDTVRDTVIVKAATRSEATMAISSPSKDKAICLGDSVQVSASGSDTIFWNYGLENGEYFTPSEAGNFNLVAKGFNSSLICESDTLWDTVVVRVPPQPKASLTISSPTKDKTICLGDSILLSAKGSDTIYWNYGLENGDYFTPSEAGSFKLIATGVNISSICGNDTVRDTVIVRVAALPEAMLTISSPSKNKTICLGDSVLVSVKEEEGITWNHGLENNTYFTPNDTGLYKLIATRKSLSLCAYGTVKDTVNIFVRSSPQLPISKGDQMMCKGDEFPQLAVESEYQVNWYDASVRGSLLQENSYTYTPKNTQSVYAEAIDLQSGCISKSRTKVSVKHYSDMTPISIYARKSKIYRGESTELMIKNYNKNNSLQWNTGAKDSSISVTPSETSMYRVTSSNGCEVKQDSMLLRVVQWRLNLGEDRYLCTKPQSVQLHPVPKPYHKANRHEGSRLQLLTRYLWNTKDTVPTITVEVDSTIVYTLSATIGNYTQTDSVKIQVSDFTFRKPLFKGCFTFIDVEATGGMTPYQYSLDNVTFQDDNRFLNIEPQEYTLYVRDSQGCMIDTFIFVNSIDVPNFFTPNSDGINDVWRVRGLENCEDAVIMISDRYSRLVKQMKIDEYWDGIYMNMLMHNDTYWNMIDFRDGVNKTLKSRITLIR